jgi:gas vesicle protein
MKINVSDKLIYLAAGCGIGAAIGLLFAPRSGHDMRQNLTSKVDKLAGQVQEKVQESGVGSAASSTFRNVIAKGINMASIGRNRVNESIGAGKRKVNESIKGEDLASR